MSPPVVMPELEHELVAGLSRNKHLGNCARRAPRPMGTRFEPWSSVGGELAEVDFVRRSSPECHVRTKLIVPLDQRKQFLAHRIPP